MTQKQRPSQEGLRGRYSTGAAGVAHREVSFGLADPETLRNAIDGAVQAGDAIMFSRTADGGALHVRILSNGDVAKWYPVSSMELHDALTDIVNSNITGKPLAR